MRTLAAACLQILLLAGFAAAQSPTVLWIDVPFVHQSKEGCGAASLSMLMEYWSKQPGIHTPPLEDPQAIQRALYSKQEHGISAPSMQRYLRAHGFQAFAIRGRWSDLEEQLGRGRPLIAAVRPSRQRELHYIVVDGVDRTRGLVTFNDPAARKLLSEEREQFEEEWSATQNWLLVAVPETQ